MLIASTRTPNDPNSVEVRGALGGSPRTPELIGVAQGAEITDTASVTQNANVVTEAGQTSGGPVVSVAVAGTAIQDPGQPVGITLDPTQELNYVVKRGDTLSSIASHFSISVASILSANPGIHKNTVQVGSTIIIPGVVVPATNSTLPNYNNQFILPAQGYTNGVLDENNGVNITNSCGTSVVAAADGVVVPDPNISETLGGWNGGYGNFVLVQHPTIGSAVYTRYAHLEKATVQIGAVVKQGQQIGLIGQTGSATACQLDFEVIGAQNPLAK